jgi:hypothetical protein
MKGYMILGSVLAVLLTPAQAQQPGTVNGNVFDAPQAYQAPPAPGYEAQPAVRAKPVRHVRRHHVRPSS